jgi:hypothetical protein
MEQDRVGVRAVMAPMRRRVPVPTVDFSVSVEAAGADVPETPRRQPATEVMAEWESKALPVLLLFRSAMNIANNKIMLGIALERFIIPHFMHSRDAVLSSLYETGQMAMPAACQRAGHRVDHNRDDIVDVFMNHPEQPDWLLFLDSDMEFPPTIGQRLTHWQKPVVGGLYFQRGDWFPMAFRKGQVVTNKYGQREQRWDFADLAVLDYLERHAVPMREGAFAIEGEDGLLECDAIATGAMCIHRSVLEAMTPPWFQIRDGTMTDDFQFCLRVKEELHLPIYCDLSTICGHYCEMATGQKEFRESMMRGKHDLAL